MSIFEIAFLHFRALDGIDESEFHRLRERDGVMSTTEIRYDRLGGCDNFMVCGETRLLLSTNFG